MHWKPRVAVRELWKSGAHRNELEGWGMGVREWRQKTEVVECGYLVISGSRVSPCAGGAGCKQVGMTFKVFGNWKAHAN